MPTVSPPKSCRSLEFAEIQQLIGDERQAVDRLIQQRLHSQVDLINQLSHYIVNSGGKRLRPMLVLLSAKALNYQGAQHIDLAAIIEFIHTATLLHDDVVDGSLLRRGNETANAIWGNQASVLVGDFLYSRAFQMMVALDNMRVMDILSETTNTIAEGEVLQLLNAGNPDTTEESYMAVNRCKTAKLFEAAARLGAVVANTPREIEDAMAEFGLRLGIAYQLVDDVLDYSAAPEEMGKNIGDDLAEGKPTLPLIYAMRTGTPEQAQLIRKAIQEGGLENIAAVKEALAATNAIAYTAKIAEREAEIAKKSLQFIPASTYRSALEDLLRFCVDRKY
ncbi:MAG: polyprenyl synthetase family protein [Pseudomonadota bacterium]